MYRFIMCQINVSNLCSCSCCVQIVLKHEHFTALLLPCPTVKMKIEVKKRVLCEITFPLLLKKDSQTSKSYGTRQQQKHTHHGSILFFFFLAGVITD